MVHRFSQPAFDQRQVKTPPAGFSIISIQKGDFLPLFTLHRNATNFSSLQFSGEQDTLVHFSLSDLTTKPLVVFFYTPSRNNPDHQANFLSNLQTDIRIMHGELLIISEAPDRYWKMALPGLTGLNIYHDPGNFMAEKLGVVDPYNPVWKWMSGIDENTPFPSLLVVSPKGRIQYAYVDPHFNMYNAFVSDEVYRRDLLTSVYQSSREVDTLLTA